MGVLRETRLMSTRLVAAAALVVCAGLAGTGTLVGARGQTPSELPKIAETVNATTEVVNYRGVRAIKLVPTPEAADKDLGMFAILEGVDFTNGTLELQVAGAPLPGASEGARGFIGVSFRTGPRGEWSDMLYLRPTNGRADDQLRRNHTVQYASDPEYPWFRLREETPGVYESYADMEAGAWTRMKIEVDGTRARLYVNGASQPCLIVNDIKHGERPGKIALWAHVETDAYFGEMRVERR
jgi:hypothetical protein